MTKMINVQGCTTCKWPFLQIEKIYIRPKFTYFFINMSNFRGKYYCFYYHPYFGRREQHFKYRKIFVEDMWGFKIMDIISNTNFLADYKISFDKFFVQEKFEYKNKVWRYFCGRRVKIPPLLISVTARPSDQRSHFMALERPKILMTLMMMTVMMMTLRWWHL